MENSFLIIEKLNIINTIKRPKKNPPYDFSTLYKTIPHNSLIKVLSEIIHVVFKSKVSSKIVFSATSTYWTSKEKRYFTEKNLIEENTFLINEGHNGIEDWKITIIDRAENVLELRRRESYWQHRLDTFIPNGPNELFVGIPIL